MAMPHNKRAIMERAQAGRRGSGGPPAHAPAHGVRGTRPQQAGADTSGPRRPQAPIGHGGIAADFGRPPAQAPARGFRSPDTGQSMNALRNSAVPMQELLNLRRRRALMQQNRGR